jgi:hypothetical protein
MGETAMRLRTRGVANPGFLVEIEVIAVKDAK